MRYSQLSFLVSTWTIQCLGSSDNFYGADINAVSQYFQERLVLNSENTHIYGTDSGVISPTESVSENNTAFFNQGSLGVEQCKSRDGFKFLFEALITLELGSESIANLVEEFGIDSLNQRDADGCTLLFHVKDGHQAKIILQYDFDINYINLFGLNAEQHHSMKGNFDVVHAIHEFKQSRRSEASTFASEIFNYGL